MSLNRHPYVGNLDKARVHSSAVHHRSVWMPQSYDPPVGGWIAPPDVWGWYNPAVFPVNQLEANLVVIQRRMRFDRIGIYVSTAGAAGAAMRFGIYNVGGNYYPTNLILEAGPENCAVIGTKESVINQTLERGWYALALLGNDGTIQVANRGYGLGPLGGSWQADVPRSSWRVAQVYGALPNPFPAGGAARTWRIVAVRVGALL